jgi:predicted Zn-dependent protease
MSVAAFDDMKSHYPISHDPERNAQLRRVGERLEHVIPWWDIGDADWEFVVFDVPEINAFAMAGGKVGVFVGLFKVVQNDDQLAAVIGHEIAHVTARHVQERLSREMAKETLGVVTTPIMAMQSASGATRGDLAFDREKETEADHIGMIYMAEAGYDPHEAIKVLERLDEVMGAQLTIPTFLSNHPPTEERIQALTDELPKAMEVYEKSQKPQAPTIIK